MDGDYIGRSLRRLEDFRFLTGSGRYVEDFSPLGPAACGCRALAARACADRRHRRRRRARDAGSARRLHRRRSRRRRDRNAALRRAGRDRRADDRAAAPGAGIGPGAACRRSGRVRRRRHPRAGARRRRANRGRVPSAALRRRCRGGARPRRAVCCGTRRPATCPTASSAATGRRSRRRLPRRRTVSRSRWSTTVSSSCRSSRAPRSAATMPRSDAFDLLLTGQGVHWIRNQLASAVFHMPPERIAVRAPDVGGGFGVKNFLYPEWVLVLWAARRLGRPVRWVAERGEEFVSSAQGRDNVTRARLALDQDGRFLALDVDTVANLGAYLSTNGPGSSTNSPASAMGGVYDIPAVFMAVSRRLYEYRADRRLSRRRQARGQLPDRAAGRPRRAAARHRPDRIAPAQRDPPLSVSQRARQ